MSNQVSEAVSQYFKEGARKLISIQVELNYCLMLYYSDRTIRRYDLSGQLYGVFKKLEDYEVFSAVFIDDSGNIAWDLDPTVDSNKIWTNRIDICADAAYMDSVEVKKF